MAFFLSSAEAGDPKTHEEAVTKYITSVLANYPHENPIAAEAFGGRIKILGKTEKRGSLRFQIYAGATIVFQEFSSFSVRILLVLLLLNLGAL